MIFADAITTLPDPNLYSSIGWVCFILFLIVAGVRQGMGLWRDLQKRSDRSEKNIVPMVAQEVFDRHVDENRKEHDQLFSKIGGVDRGAAARIEAEVKGMRAERKGDVKELYDKINSLRENVAGLTESKELLNQQMASYNADIKRVLERLPRRGGEFS